MYPADGRGDLSRDRRRGPPFDVAGHPVGSAAGRRPTGCNVSPSRTSPAECATRPPAPFLVGGWPRRSGPRRSPPSAARLSPCATWRARRDSDLQAREALAPAESAGERAAPPRVSLADEAVIRPATATAVSRPIVAGATWGCAPGQRIAALDAFEPRSSPPPPAARSSPGASWGARRDSDLQAHDAFAPAESAGERAAPARIEWMGALEIWSKP